MTVATTASPVHPTWGLLVIAGAAVVALVSARDYAGCWNDGSRLATVESLVDYGTLAIDDSIFVRVPPNRQPAPYRRDDPGLLERGTGDKLLIRGHFYSDKSPVPALLLAGAYKLWQTATGLTARARPDRFIYAMTVVSSGLAYVVAVWCVFQLGRPLGLSPPLRLLLTTSFAFGTVALPYVRHVNNHILLLGVAAALMLGLAWLAHGTPMARPAWGRLLGLGSLAGLGYAIDLGAGPVLLVLTIAVVAWRCRAPAPVAVFLLAALPWLALHHGVNYAVGGTFKPANAMPEYFQWPGCIFTPQNLTGSWNHRSLGRFLLYAGDLLLGKRGFLGHNLALLLALPACAVLLWRRVPQWPELLFAACWSGGTWLAYAVTSNNLSGQCCSVRWFVPLLAPMYYVLAVLLRTGEQGTGLAFRARSKAPSPPAPLPRSGGEGSHQRGWVLDLSVLTAWGVVVAGLAWVQGPWMKHMVPGYWLWLTAALLNWVVAGRWIHIRTQRAIHGEATTPTPARAA